MQPPVQSLHDVATGGSEMAGDCVKVIISESSLRLLHIWRGERAALGSNSDASWCDPNVGFLVVHFFKSRRVSEVPKICKENPFVSLERKFESDQCGTLRSACFDMSAGEGWWRSGWRRRSHKAQRVGNKPAPINQNVCVPKKQKTMSHHLQRKRSNHAVPLQGQWLTQRGSLSF